MKVSRGFKFTNIRGQIRVLLDGAVSDRPFFLYGAKFERYTGQKSKGPVRHALMWLLLLPYSCMCHDGTPLSDRAIFHLDRPLPAWKTSPLPAGSPHPIQSFPNVATLTSGDGAPPTAWNRALSSLQIPLHPRWLSRPPPRWERLPPSPLLRQEPEHRRGHLLAVTGLASSFLCW
jgi:hypothetical protein